MDVQRHLKDEPVVARPPGNLYRFQKLVRRNKLVFAAAAAVVAALAIGLGLTSWQFLAKSRAEREQSRLREEAQLAQASEVKLRRQAEAQERAAEVKTYAVSMNLAQQALQIDNLGRAVELLDQQRPAPGKPDFRGWEWRYLWQFCRNDAKATLCVRSNTITSLACSRDGTRVAVATEDGELTLWDGVNGQEALQMENHYHSVTRVAFPPTGSLLAFADGTNVVIWNCRDRREVARLPVGMEMRDLRFIGENRVLAVAMNFPNDVSIWDLSTRLPVMNAAAPIHGTGIGTKFTATGDGTVIAFAFSNKLVKVVDLERKRDDWVFPVTEEHTTALAFSADGTVLATGAGYTESVIKLWSVPNREFIGQLEGHRSWIASLKFLPDGTLASASADQTIRIWDVAARQSLHTLHGHHAEVRVLDATQDGRTLISGGKDGAVLVWDLAAQASRPQWWQTIDSKLKPGIVSGFEFSPDSRMIAVVENEAVKIYDAATLQPLQTPDFGLHKVAKRLMFSPDSRLLVATDTSGRVGVWDVPDGRRVTNFVAHAGAAGLLGSTFLNHGQTFLTWGTDNLGKEWDIAAWQEKARWPLTEKNTHITTVWSSSSTNGLLAIKLGGETNLQVFMAGAPAQRRVQDCPLWVVALSFSPDEKTLAAACEDGSLTLWDARTLARKAILHDVLLGLHSVAFSPDGRRIAAGSNGREAVKIWDADSHEELLTLEGKGSLFADTRFSPDGNMIAACGWSGILHIWRAPTWAEIITLP
jgi:WD40 repeat protein